VTILVLQITLVGLLLFLSAVFSGSETALFSLKPYQVRRFRRRPSRNSILVASLLKDPYHLLVTIVIGNTLVNVAASSIGTDIVGHFFKQGVLGISVAVMTTLILILGEIVPKTIAVQNPMPVSLATSPIISSAIGLFSPLKVVLEVGSKLAARLNPPKTSSSTAISGEHVTEAIAFGHSQGVLDEFEREVLGGVFRLMRLSVQNIMTPRTEVFMLASNVTLSEAMQMVKSSGYSRIPVFDVDERDIVKGILYAKDLLYGQYPPDTSLGEVAREPAFVPESKPLVDLLDEFVSGAAHFAVVIDEYGSFSGIVTLDDILSEVIGRDGGRHLEKYAYTRRSRLRWEVSGRMEIEYFNALIGAAISDPHAETVAGFVISRLGRIPTVGEVMVDGGLTLRITDADERHIKRIEVERMRK
jgi:putative hemolysin